MMREFHTVESLTFVPNQFCNFGCSYCYLGDLTNNTDKYDDICEKLQATLDSYTESGILINLIMFHGAEVTVLPKDILEKMFQVCSEYFYKYRIELSSFKVKTGIHIKTNFYRCDKLIDILKKYNVSISASIDIPFSHHVKYRTLKNGKESLTKIKENIKLFLSEYPSNLFSMSCTIGKYAFDNIEEFMNDIEWMDSIGFDIRNNFYIMFIYDSVNSKEKVAMTDSEMVIFLIKLLKRWKNTKYERAIYYSWFKEFTHNYCTNMRNCGTYNNLVQKNGNVFPCHRSQPDSNLLFGNINNMSMLEIRNSGTKTMQWYESENIPLHKDCIECPWFYLCNVGCPIARRDMKDNKSYTCKLQLELYKRQPIRFPPDPVESARAVDAYIQQMQPRVYDDKTIPRIMRYNPEFMERKNSIVNIIQNDEQLQILYKSGNIKLIRNNDEPLDLISSTYELRRIELNISKDDKLKLFIDKSMIKEDLEDEGLHISFLNTNMIVYGDEQRTKMTHIQDYDILKNELEKIEDGYLCDVTDLFLKHKDSFKEGIENAFYVTSISCRRYHYLKHSKNAFYHIEAINLPFHNFWFEYK